MKRMKKLLAVMLAVVMVASMGMNVWADDATYSIKINDVASNNHTFTAYQIFKGTVSGDQSTGYVLSDITWGDSVNYSALLSYLTTTETAAYTDGSTWKALFGSCTTAADVAGVLTTNNSNTALIKAFADLLATYTGGSYTYLSSTYKTTNTADAGSEYSYTISELPAGYYLVIDSLTDASATDSGEVVSDYLLQVVGDTTLSTKTVVPSIRKTVDNNGSDSSYNTAAEGDTVDFKLSIDVPNDLSSYSTYKLVVTDTFSTGLTLNESTIQIKIGTGAEATVSAYDQASTQNIYYEVSGSTLTITVLDLLTEDDYTSGADVTITYSATLSSSATQGNSGNENKATLEYSNNPNDTSSTGTTKETKTTTYTTSLTIYKTDGSTFLPGAYFTLYEDDGETVVKSAQEVTNADGLTFTGLTEGTYVLKETTTPSGYNTAENITFTLTYTEGTGWSVSNITPSGTTISDSGSGTFSTIVVNNSGSTIPTTGGIGTTIFYIVGAILVLGAGVVLITRRRMASR